MYLAVFSLRYDGVTGRVTVRKVVEDSPKVKSSSMSAKRKQAKVQLLISRDGDRCWYCWRGFTDKIRRTLDHKTPVSANGTNSIENLVLCCEECNQVKGNRIRDYKPGCFRNLYRI